ncbi:L-gulonolactone oxidase-like, partial [Empidonax traillii]|uniref:L-gulonolactone oxidase-like n=1 Tax=Empidonax traillii TaxID=164674 RepID=UPI000FFD4D0F
ILDLARQRGRRVKVVGGGHSPSDIACTDGFLLHLGHMDSVLQADREKLQVTVEGGILLSRLNAALDELGMALPNLGAVSEVTAGGVIGTGTHNTGIAHGILPTQVVAVTLLTASGDILECSESRNSELFPAARLHLGSLGVVLSVTFQCVPKFQLREVAFPGSLPQVPAGITFFPGLVRWINRGFFRLLFGKRQERVGRSHRIFTYDCRFQQHVQDWAIP